MNYLAAGNRIEAARWNDLFQQADAQLTTMLGGLSAVFAEVGNSGPYGVPDYADKQWDRGFFFGFDPVNPPNTLHPLALRFIGNYLAHVQDWQNAMFWRQYDHSAITGQLAGLSQLSNTSKWNVVKLALPSWAAWSAAVYPSGFGTSSDSGLKQTISGVDYPAYNCLDVSLQVHKASVGGMPYNVTFDTVLTAEHAQPLKGIDIFTLGNFTWDEANWDKYSIVRIHNVGKTAATATFGSASATLPPGGCKCFRKVAGAWQVNGNYFHWMNSGDGRFLQMRETGNPSDNGYTGGAPSIFMPGIVTDVLNNVLAGAGDLPSAAAGNFGMQPDVTKFFDMAAVYANPDYVKSSPDENAPPAGGYFPVPSGTTPIGDLIIPRGKFLVANRAVPNVVHAKMTKAVVMTPDVPAPTYEFADPPNTVANVSNASVYNVTTGQSIPMQSDPSDIMTINWQANYTTQQIAIIPRGSVYDPGTGTFVPASPTPYAPFISNGDVLEISFDYIPPDDHVLVDFDSFGTLAAKLASVGLSTRALSETSPFDPGVTINNLEIYSASGWHLVDLSCPLVTFLTGGSAPLPAKIVGANQSATPPSLKLPWLVFTATVVSETSSGTNFSYKNWALDGSGNYVLGSTVSLTVSNKGTDINYDSTHTPKVFLPNETLGDLETWIRSQSEAGGILVIGAFEYRLTPFGHVMIWDELWPLDARFAQVALYEIPSFYGIVRTLGIFYEENVGLHVKRMVLLNETKLFGYYGTGDGNPWEHGIFPPIRGADRLMFWNYARVDRQFVDSRWYQRLASDSPWMPTSGWVNYRFWSSAPGPFVFYDDLTFNEFNHVVSFYEATPIGEDTVGTAVARAKTGISRMGAFSRAADIWSPFSYWLQKISSLSYPNGASPASINTGSGWYYANTSSLMANANISNPIPNALPCQMEHFNAAASLAEGIPQFKWDISKLNIYDNTSTQFTLNFAAENIIIVNGGTGYSVNDTFIMYPATPDAFSLNVKVGSVDANGKILTLIQDGVAASLVCDVYGTHRRPFKPAGGTGTGLLIDTSSGDGSALNFIPTHTNIGVPVPPNVPGKSENSGAGTDYSRRVMDTYWPRQSFYSWNGATPGGADPVRDYLVSLGVPVQTGVPGNYGQPLPIYSFDWQTDGSVTDNRVSGYVCGCDADFQTAVNTYRWIKMDDARTLYEGLSIPFVLSELVVPYSWVVASVTGTISTINPSSPPGVMTPIGPVNPTNADFFNDANGDFVRAYHDEKLAAASSPLADPIRSWNLEDASSSSVFLITYPKYGAPYDNGIVTTVYITPMPGFPGGWSQVTFYLPQKLSYDLTVVLALSEGVPDSIAACLPQNAAYYDEPWVALNPGVYYNLGTQVVPIIADNSIESSQADGVVIPGQPSAPRRAGDYEHLITTSLLNARLVLVPIDGQIQNNPPPPAGI